MRKARFISLALTLVLLIGALPLAGAFTVSGEEIPDRILFSSSFEKDDPQIRPSVSDNGYYNGITALDIKENIDGEFTDSVDMASVRGSSDFKAEESKRMLFDMSASTKYLHSGRASASNPVRVEFELSEPQVLRVYNIVSANDEPGRDPKAWIIYGSQDGENYVQLDKRSGQSFSSRAQTKVYNIENETEYKYFRFDITENGGSDMTQLADLRLGTGIPVDKESGDSPMASVISGGPSASWSAPGAFDGRKTLAIYGKQNARKDTYARNVLYTGLSLPVSDNTVMSYVHFPAIMTSGYDFEYTSMHAMIDLKFTDGSYLSELGAKNTDGFTMEPDALGEEGSLNSMQWNFLETKLGKVAAGRTIESIYVYFNMKSTGTASQFQAFFDDLMIEDKADAVYENLSDYIDTRRGTNNTTAFSRGLTTPFCTLPNGFSMYTPVTNPGSNDPYSYFDHAISQFSVTHVASTWVGDYGTWQFMANTNIPFESLASGSLAPANLESSFDRSTESAKAHYYGVTFDEGTPASGVKVEIAPTLHGAYVRMTFPENSENVNVVFDCYRADGSLTIKNDGTFNATSQHRNNGSSPLRVYGVFDQTPAAYKVIGSKSGMVSFEKGTTEVTFRLATSYLSNDRAKHTLSLEIPEGKSFDDIKKEAQDEWEKKCRIFEIEGATYNQLVTFYSCVYRMYSYPNLYSENVGTSEKPEWVYASPYHGGKQTAGKIYVNNGFWDTYRTAWAAYALFTPELDGMMLDGLIQHYKDNGWIPRWIAPGGAESMLGTSSDIIFADAYIKGVQFDYMSAYESMLRNAATVSSDTRNGGRAENETAVFTGYVSNSTNHGFSWTMEDYISDYCIGVMAKALGRDEEAEYYSNRAKFYIDMYNDKVGFFMGKNKSGEFGTGNYNPAGWWGDYSETNGWTMSFATVYDGNGLANLYGGKDKLAKKLDSYFDNGINSMKKVADGSIHEMVEARETKFGQYAHSNQPGHALPYMYAYSSTPYKTQAITREVLKRLYLGSAIGQGYCGDEDNGEMSAWYVLSSIGLYPQTMGSGEYIITSPLFDKVTVNLENGKKIVVTAENNSDTNVYIQSATVNGKAYNSLAISHSLLCEGAEITYKMGDQPSAFGTEEADSESYRAPLSLTAGDGIASRLPDVVGSKFKTAEDYATLAKTPKIYSDSIEGYKKLFDNTSATAVGVNDKSSVIYSWETPTELSMITLTSGKTASKTPTSFLLEGSNNGRDWKIITERNDLSFKWGLYTMPFVIPEEQRGTFYMYRLTFGSGNGAQLAEIELLGAESSADKLTEVPESPVDPADPGENPDGPAQEPQTAKTPVGLIIGICAALAAAIAGVVIAVLILKKKKK